MCEVCSEALHCVALLYNTNVITGLGMCKVCTGTRGQGVVNGTRTNIYYNFIYVCMVPLNI